MEQSQFEKANQQRLEFVGQTKVDENLEYKMKYRIIDPCDPNYGHLLVYKCQLMTHVSSLVEVIEPPKQLDLEI